MNVIKKLTNKVISRIKEIDNKTINDFEFVAIITEYLEDDDVLNTILDAVNIDLVEAGYTINITPCRK